MEIDHGRQILEILVNWYEGSPAHTRGQTPSRRRIMRLYDGGKTDFPTYNIEDHLEREAVNRAVMDLAGKGLVGYEWMRGQRDHILAKLWLKSDAIEQAYAYLGRRPKGDIVDELLLTLMELRDNTTTEWACLWLEETISTISRRRSIGSAMPDLPSERDDLLKAVSYLTCNDEIEMLERVFSLRCFGDSKHFERTIKTRLAGILRKYLVKDDCTDEEALRLAGLVSYPEQFAFSGALSIMLPGGMIDFAPLSFGGTLSIDDVKRGRITLSMDIERILTVENRANYVEYTHRYQKHGELVLYHGGHFSPAKRVFLEAIVSAKPQGCEFLHWGDIDYGGFTMLARLRREISPDVQPWRMGEDELIRYAAFTTGFTESYRKKLVSLLSTQELSDCVSCIEYMIKAGVRLEQEAMLT